MMPDIAAFPKCYVDEILSGRMALSDWLSMAGGLGVDGGGRYEPFFDGKGRDFVRAVRNQCRNLGLAIPMMCFSPDFTQPEATARRRELRRQKRAIDLTVTLGGSICRTL